MDAQEVVACLRSSPLFHDVEPPAIEALVRASRVVPFRAKRTVLKQDDPAEAVYFLLRGSVRVFHRAPPDREVLVKLFGAPALFGEMEVLSERRFLEFVATLESSALLVIPAAAFVQLLRAQPVSSLALARDLAARLCVATQHERALAFMGLEARLCNLLVDYGKLCGAKSGAVRIELPLTQDGMARDLGASRKAVREALDKLRGAGLVDKREGRYVISDLHALAARGSAEHTLYYTAGAASTAGRGSRRSPS